MRVVACLAAAALAAGLLARGGRRDAPVDRDRRHGRRVLRLRRRARPGAEPRPAGRRGHRRGHRRLGREPELPRAGLGRPGVLARRHRGGRGRGPRALPLAPAGVRAGRRSTTTSRTSWCRADGPVRTVADLRGRRVSLGSPNSGTEVIAERVLRAAGLDPARDCAASGWASASRPTRSRTGRSTRSSGRAACPPPPSWSWPPRPASASACSPTPTWCRG